jgi:DNA-binding NarL/FixJ family response regulator
MGDTVRPVSIDIHCMDARSHPDRSSTTCVVADDHPPILDCLARYLETVGFTVLASALDGEKALDACLLHRPSVCVADLHMPALSGVELAGRLAEHGPETRVLVYSGVSDPALVSEALEAGALGFALKDAPLDQLATAIDTVASGQIYVDPVLGAALLQAQRGDTARPLSEREREVLRLLAEGASYAEMGTTLFLSPETVRAHAQRAMTKVGARTRTQAVAVALRDGLIA